MINNNYYRRICKLVFAFSLAITPIFHECRAQNYGLKIISVSDSSSITQDLRVFDSIWFQCMKGYGKEDISTLFADYQPETSKTNPITLLNFITGIDAPFSDVFVFKLIYSQNFSDSLIMYQMDMGWMQIALYFNRKLNKLMRYESFNGFKLIASKYKNTTVFSISEISKSAFKIAHRQTLKALNDLGLDKDSFYRREFIMYSGKNLKEAFSFVGGLEYVNFFVPSAQYGGMGDPFNNVILSGIPKSIHVHELMHFAIEFPCNGFIGEGLASYYGGVGGLPYRENLEEIIQLIRSRNIHTFSEIMHLWRLESHFNNLRGSYVMAAYMLEHIRSKFGLNKYREFVRNCKSDQEMIESLKLLYMVDSETQVFDKIFWAN